MLKNNFKIAFRTLFRNKVFFAINVLGLAIGITASLLILNWVNFERSYDTFNDDFNRIFRLRYERTSNNGESARFASCAPPAAPAIREQLPEVELAGRLFKTRSIVTYKNNSFIEDRIFYTEPEVLKILKFDFSEGHPPEDLRSPGHAYISQSYAQKYFGTVNPIGKKIEIDKNSLYEIMGIYKDAAANSHLKCDILLSFKNLDSKYGPEVLESWGETGFYTYLKLKSGYDLKLVETKIADLLEREAGELFRYYEIKAELPLQSLADIHLTSNFMHEYETNGNKEILNILFLISILILLIAWVNYINLSTAQSLKRVKEIGLRKVIGASKTNLIMQLFTEVFIVNSIAVMVSFLLLFLSSPLTAKITGMDSGAVPFTQPGFAVTVLLVFAGGILLSGLVPVLIVSSFRLIDALKGKIRKRTGNVTLRKYLVTIQFIFAIILLMGSITVYQQIHFLKNQDLGFDTSDILVFQMPRVRDAVFDEQLETFKKVLIQDNIVSEISCVTEVPGRQIYWDAGGIHRAGADISESRNYQIVGIDYDFIPLFRLQMAAGRNFSREFTTDPQAVILNETAVKWLGFESASAAIGQRIDYWGDHFTVVGTVKNFHQQSPKSEFEPHIYRFLPSARAHRGVFAAKISKAVSVETINKIKNNFAAFFPGNPFQYFFLDEYYNQQYEPDMKFAGIIRMFTGLAIFITMIGLFGIALFTTGQKTKEIGIRKAVGSSTPGIVMLLSKEFLKWVIAANLFAWPLAYYFLNMWLQTFAKRIEISWWIFVLSGLSVLVITLLTVSYQSVKAALANPVESLRYE